MKHNKKKNYNNPVKTYNSFEDCLNQLGYTKRPNKLGDLGQALLTEGNKQPKGHWLRNFWDKYFKDLRQKKRNKNKGKQKHDGKK